MHRSGCAAVPVVEGTPFVAAPPSARPPSATWRRVTTLFAAAIDSALEAATRVERDPQEALHSFRRQVRRARALVAACHDQLPAAGRLELHWTLRRVTRATGAMRDHDALPEALAKLPFDEKTAEARAHLESRLVQSRLRSRSPLKRARRLAVAAAKVGRLPALFESLLPITVDAAALSEGWRRLATRARKAVRAARAQSDDTAAVHEARKRLRTLANAMEQLAPDGSRAAKRAPRYARLASKFGATLDDERLARHARRTGLADGAAGQRLVARLERRVASRRERLLLDARRALSRRRIKSAAG